MQIKDLLQQYKEPVGKKFKSERAELIQKFTDRLNEDRKAGGYNPITAKIVSIKMAESGLKSLQDLYWYYGYCNDAKNFSKCWWYNLNPTKYEK